MLPFKNINKINKYDKNTVHGYIRRIQRLLEDQVIPLVVNSICLSFFYVTDQFGTNVKKEMMVNEDGTIITMKEFGINLFTGAYNGCSCFGMMDIMNGEYFSKFIYQWRFEYYMDPILFRQGSMKEDVIIGIADSPNVDWYKSDYGHHVALSSYGCLYKTKYIPSQTCQTELYSQNITEFYGADKWILPKDEIIINIDIKEEKMEYIVIRADTTIDGYHFKDIPIKFLCGNHKYRIAVYCQGIGMSTKLIKFNKIARTSDDQ